MTLEQYGSALIKRWKLIVLCLVVVGLGVYIASKLMTPQYQSTALVILITTPTVSKKRSRATACKMAMGRARP
jgi:uncharacterized protein involved in exopolysaccharide biosynthesis